MNFDELGKTDKMAGMRTALAFQRNRIAADRTLMAVIRTSLSMIGFGFTIYTFTSNIIQRTESLGLLRPEAPIRFGLTLIFLGVLILALGIVNHYQYMKSLRHQRKDFVDEGLMPQKEMFPVSLALITAFLLAILGLYTALSIILRAGLFF
jgi:putative membrane protein